MELNLIANVIKKQKNALIITHTNPDGDALGSSFALKFMLDKIGIESEVVLEKPIPRDFNFTGWKPLIFNENINGSFVIGLDVSDTLRFGICADIFIKSESQVIIDHHLSTKNECELLYSDSGSAATGEIIYRLLKLLDIKLDKDIATALYISIMSDTGGCKFGNTTANTHFILADLIGFVNHAYVNRMIFDIMSMEKVKLQGKLLSEIEFYADGQIGVISAEAGIAGDEYELNGMVNLALNIEGARAGVLFKEKGENEIKVSLRTAGDINAMEVCAAFGGGGHKNAAGCTIHESLGTAKNLFLDKLKEHI